MEGGPCIRHTIETNCTRPSKCTHQEALRAIIAARSFELAACGGGGAGGDGGDGGAGGGAGASVRLQDTGTDHVPIAVPEMS